MRITLGNVHSQWKKMILLEKDFYLNDMSQACEYCDLGKCQVHVKYYIYEKITLFLTKWCLVNISFVVGIYLITNQNNCALTIIRKKLILFPYRLYCSDLIYLESGMYKKLSSGRSKYTLFNGTHSILEKCEK